MSNTYRSNYFGDLFTVNRYYKVRLENLPLFNTSICIGSEMPLNAVIFLPTINEFCSFPINISPRWMYRNDRYNSWWVIVIIHFDSVVLYELDSLVARLSLSFCTTSSTPASSRGYMMELLAKYFKEPYD